MYRLLIILFLSPVIALAHQPVISHFENYNDTQTIVDPTISTALYGELTGFPHTYSVEIAETEKLFVEVLVPDIDGAENTRSGIIVKKLPRGPVQEIARLNAKTADWETFFEPFGGDSYRRGGSFEGEVESGSYLIEVSTPINIGKYVLVVGKEEDFSGVGIFQTMGRIYQVKRFFGKPPIAVLQSPLYYIPTIILIFVVGFVFYRKKKHA